MIKKSIIVAISLSLVSCCKKTTVTECIKNEAVTKDCQNILTKTEMNGVSMVSVRNPIDSSAYTAVSDLNASWVSIIPFGFVRSGVANVEYNAPWQWHGEKKIGTIESIALAQQRGIKILLKPHLWVIGNWVGDLEFTNETDWQTFESTYTTFIVDFAQIADSMGVETFCIGVELRKSVVQRPAYWNQLIDSIKKIYSGKLTYAANWDNYENVTFWNKLDYIGIDSYFPIAQSKTPTFSECYDGWNSDFNKIKAKSLSENKKVIFTEYGFRNVDYTGKEPWDDNENSTFNTEGQKNAYAATFCRFWGESWFEGGFLWKWYPDHANAGGDQNNRFTPQNKPVEELIRQTFEATNE